jgi:ketosteroid isomerase-like protein
MSHPFDEKVAAELWATVRAMNDAWTKGDPDRLRDYFHDAMVAVTPVDRNRLEGGEACVAGWKRFCDAARIHYWREIEPSIQTYEDAAVVTYYFDMSFDMGGKTVHSEGREMYFFVRENGRWWAVANQFSPYPAK